MRASSPELSKDNVFDQEGVTLAQIDGNVRCMQTNYHSPRSARWQSLQDLGNRRFSASQLVARTAEFRLHVGKIGSEVRISELIVWVTYHGATRSADRDEALGCKEPDGCLHSVPCYAMPGGEGPVRRQPRPRPIFGALLNLGSQNACKPATRQRQLIWFGHGPSLPLRLKPVLDVHPQPKYCPMPVKLAQDNRSLLRAS